jgi:hypothetical protein
MELRKNKRNTLRDSICLNRKNERELSKKYHEVQLLVIQLLVINSTLALYTHCFVLRTKGVHGGIFFGLN